MPSKPKAPPTVTLTGEAWYRCPECEEIIPDQERRCFDCNKFGAKVIVWLECSECEHKITDEELG